MDSLIFGLLLVSLSAFVGAIIGGLALLLLYIPARIIEMLIIMSRYSISYMSALDKKSVWLEPLRRCGKFIFKWRRIPLIIVAIGYGGFWELCQLSDSDRAPSATVEITAFTVLEVLAFSLVSAIVIGCVGDFFFWIIRKYESCLEPCAATTMTAYGEE